MRLFNRIKDPVKGTAQVVYASSPASGSSNCTCRMDLVVSGPGIEPTAVEHKCGAPTDRWPWPGTTLPVTFDREDPTRLDVRWKEVPKARDVGRRQAEQVAAAMRGEAPAAGPAAGPAGLGGAVQVHVDPSGDPDEQLAKLARLRAAGVLSDEQLAQVEAQITARRQA